MVVGALGTTLARLEGMCGIRNKEEFQKNTFHTNTKIGKEALLNKDDFKPFLAVHKIQCKAMIRLETFL